MQATLQVSPIVNSVRRVLHKSGLFGLSTLDLEFSDGRLRIEGILSSFYLKQMAQELAMKVEGVTQIDNAVEVD